MAATSRRPPALAIGIGAVVVAVVVAAAGMAWTGTGPWGPTLSLPAPHYVEEAAAAGVDIEYAGGFHHFVGGGVAVFDCDDDGRQDLYIAGGEAPAGLFANRSPVGGALAFDRLTDPATDLPDVSGAYPLDIDGDRVVDLAVLRVGEDVVLRGLGDCRFERANEALGLAPDDAWTAAFSATWEAGSDRPTLAFGDYVVLTDDVTAPRTCEDSRFVRPAREGGYADPIPLSPGWCPLSILFSSWDRSGRADLRVSNDRHYYRDGQEQLWRIEPGEAPRMYLEEDGWMPVRIWGMGIASQDLSGDGYPEIYLTSQADNKLQTLADGPAQPTYEDIALAMGTTAHRPYAGDDVLPSTAWHAEFGDVNADGYADLFVAKGNVEAQVEYAMADPSNLLIGQADGTFVEGAEAAGMLDFTSTRGAALADLNLDGMLDLVKVTRHANVQLWRNVGSGTADAPVAMGRALMIDVEQPGGNGDAIGAWLSVRIGDRLIERELTIGGGHAGGQLGWTHVGIGDAERAEVQVTWPDGEVGPWLPIDAGTFATLDRAAGLLPWDPATVAR